MSGTVSWKTMDLINHVYTIFRSVINGARAWFLHRIFSTERATKLQIDSFVPWLETHLLSSKSLTIQKVDCIMNDFDKLVSELRQHTTDCRDSILNNSNQQIGHSNNRTLRVCDQIDILCGDYYNNKQCSGDSSRMLYPINSSLPDSDYLRELTHRTRNRLKVIDEISQSKKSDSATKPSRGNNSGGKGDSGRKPFELPAIIRGDISGLSRLLEALDAESATQSTQLGYFASIKQIVHKPIHIISLAFAEVPDMREVRQSTTTDFTAYEGACDAYIDARTSEVLHTAATTRREMQEIEGIVGGLFECVREAVVGKQAASMVALINGIAAGRSRSADSGTPNGKERRLSNTTTPPTRVATAAASAQQSTQQQPADVSISASGSASKAVRFSDSDTTASDSLSIRLQDLTVVGDAGGKTSSGSGGKGHRGGAAPVAGALRAGTAGGGRSTESGLAAQLIKLAKKSASELLQSAAPPPADEEFSPSPLGAVLNDLQVLLSSNRSLWCGNESLCALVEAVLLCDWELIEAYGGDWTERQQFLSRLLRSEEFTSAYKQLHTARLTVRSARTRYERAQQYLNAAVERHRELSLQLVQLKRRLSEVALSELGEETVFLLD